MYEIYNIMNNDTLESIAKCFDTTIDNLIEINGISSNYIPISGNNIIVPSIKNSPYKYYTVKKGDTITTIAKDYNLDHNLLLKINGLDKDDYIYPNQTILIPQNNFKFYLTQSQDTLRGISKNFNIDTNTLIEENSNILLAENQIITFKEK